MQLLHSLLYFLSHMSETLRASIIGGMIGGSIPLFGVWLAHRVSERSRRRRKKEEIQNLLSSLHTELKSLWERYNVTVGPELDKLSDPTRALYARVPISHDLITVYNANASKLGSIPNVLLRESIVSTYLWIKTLIESLKANSDYYDEFRNYVAQKGKKDQFSDVTEDFLRAFGRQLYATHLKLGSDVPSLLSMLEDRTSRR